MHYVAHYPWHFAFPNTGSLVSVLLINNHKSPDASFFHDLCIDNQGCQDLGSLGSAVVVADPVMASRRLEKGAASPDDMRRAVVHLVQHRALEDEDRDRSACVAVRWRRCIWWKGDQ